MWIRLSCFPLALVYAMPCSYWSRFRHQRQQRKAVPLHAKMMEIHFSLQEGSTIIGVMDRKKTMRFYSGKDAMDEKSYE